MVGTSNNSVPELAIDCQKTMIPFLSQHQHLTSPGLVPGTAEFAERTRALRLCTVRVPVRAADAAGGWVISHMIRGTIP